MSNIGRFSFMPSRIYRDNRITRRTDLVIMGALCTFTSKEGGNWCWPSRRLISEMTGISKSNITKSITRLIQFGYVQKEKQYRPNLSDTSNKYKILMDNEVPIEHLREIKRRSPIELSQPSKMKGCYYEHREGVNHDTPKNASLECYNKKKDEKISLQKDVDISEQRSGETTKDISDNKIKPDYKPRITIEEKIKKDYKCSDGAYEMALKEFILYNQEKDNESLNWDNLFERWCLNRAQWREKPPINKNTDPSGISPSERVQNNVTKRLNEFERNIFNYLASILEPNEYISSGFLLLKLEYVIEGRIRFSHIARDVCDILIAKYMDKIKLAVQAFRADITDYEIVAKS